jgi:hypothetical protein
MKCELILAVTVFSSLAAATPDPDRVKAVLESAPACSNFVRFDDENVYLGEGGYKEMFEEPRHPMPAHVHVRPLAPNQTPFDLATNDSTIDAVREGSSLFVLTYSGLEEWDLPSRKRTAVYPTYNGATAGAYKEHAEGFARYGNKLILAHGRFGVSFFDLKEKKITNQFRLLTAQFPLESMAVGVTIHDHRAFVAIDNFTLTPTTFRGMVVIDMDTETVAAQWPGLDPGADSIVADGDRLVVSYGGVPIWGYDFADLQGIKALPAPLIHALPFAVKGHPIGHASVDDRYYYTCFSRAPEKRGALYQNVPLAIERDWLFSH